LLTRPAVYFGWSAFIGGLKNAYGTGKTTAVRVLTRLALPDSGRAAIDAMHTQGDTAQAIFARHADYVMTVKGNMPAPPPWPPGPADPSAG